MSATEDTANDVFNSLTGYDEIGIKKEFKQDVYSLAKEDRAGFMRALIFIHHQRAGMKHLPAYKATMEMRQDEVTEYFADEPDDEDGEGDDLGED